MNDQITINNKNGNGLTAEGIAYFQSLSRNKSFVLYTLGEIVADNREKMYVGEVFTGNNIVQDQISPEDWVYLNDQLKVISRGEATPDLKFMPMTGIVFNTCEPKKLAIPAEAKQIFKAKQMQETINLSQEPAIEPAPIKEEVPAFTSSAETATPDFNIFETPIQPIAPALAAAEASMNPEIQTTNPEIPANSEAIDETSLKAEEQQKTGEKQLSDEEITSQLDHIKEAAQKIIEQSENLKNAIMQRSQEKNQVVENSQTLDLGIENAAPTITNTGTIAEETPEFIYTGAEDLSVPAPENMNAQTIEPQAIDPLPESFSTQPDMNVIASDGNLYQVTSNPTEETPTYTANGSISMVQPPEVQAVSDVPPVVMPDAYAGVQNMNGAIPGLETPSTLPNDVEKTYSMGISS